MVINTMLPTKAVAVEMGRQLTVRRARNINLFSMHLLLITGKQVRTVANVTLGMNPKIQTYLVPVGFALIITTSRA